MKSKEFYDLAVKMRYAQRHYFESRDKYDKKYWLSVSKSYERQMDAEIERVNGIINKKN